MAIVLFYQDKREPATVLSTRFKTSKGIFLVTPPYNLDLAASDYQLLLHLK